MTLPSGASPARVPLRRRARGAELGGDRARRPGSRSEPANAVPVRDRGPSRRASCATPSASTITFRAVFDVTSFVWWSITRSMSVTRRPNDAALVTSLPSISFAPAQMYCWCVWPLTITSTWSSSPLTMSTMAPERLSQLLIPAHPGRSARDLRSRTARSGCRPRGAGSRTTGRPPRPGASRRACSRLDLVAELEALDRRRRHDQRRPLESHADERDLGVVDLADLVRRQDVSSVPAKNTFAAR